MDASRMLASRQSNITGLEFDKPLHRKLVALWLPVALSGWLAAASCLAAEHNAASAIESLTAARALRHVQVLADDTFEGREAGSRGGRASALYLVQQLKQHSLRGGNSSGSFYQPFGNGYSNVLARLEGSDPELKKQVIVVSAHYDHVGYGNRRNSQGPVGYIHNGADDNASGVAGLLEVAAACGTLSVRPRRTILFAFWDGEEKGLLGSRHWVDSPTVPLTQVVLMMNTDMIGRMRKGRLDIYGTRTSFGMRRLVSQQNAGLDLLLNFTWELKENSDHFPFYARRIPVLMPHTGMHNDYHRPSDDVDQVNGEGLQQVSRLMLKVLLELADRPKLGGFRPACAYESPWTQQVAEAPLPSLPGRLGVRWDDRLSDRVIVLEVMPGSPADRGGLRSGDRILKFAGRDVHSPSQFRAGVLAAVSPTTVFVERTGEKESRELSVQLGGSPVKVGISWRFDDAQPDCAMLNRVVPGSPAAVAGLKVGERIYQINGRDFATSDQFKRLLAESANPLTLLVEDRGRLRSAVVELATQSATSASVLPPLSPRGRGQGEGERR